MIKKTVPAKTISIELSVYTELKGMKIVDEESFNSVIKKILVENQRLKKELQAQTTDSGDKNGHI